MCVDSSCCFEDLTRCAVDIYKGTLDVVDIFDAKSGTWSTAKLSVARWGFSATSLPSQGLALFAGGGGALLRK